MHSFPHRLAKLRNCALHLIWGVGLYHESILVGGFDYDFAESSKTGSSSQKMLRHGDGPFRTGSRLFSFFSVGGQTDQMADSGCLADEYLPNENEARSSNF
jgi:hypothetical protein